MILGIGIDLVEVSRIKKLLNDRFLNRILSKEELLIYESITDLNRKLTFVSGRFAAKEAIFKAISKGFGNTNYIDFSILNDENGKPYVKTNYFNPDEVIHISITHTNKLAIAYVMIEKL
jgi:holo-[acyl-carrier protein] synthase